MSVRRLAEDSVQPAAFAFHPENAEWAEATIRKYPEGRQQSAVIPLLMRAQEQDGWVTRAAIESIAQMLSMPLIRVLEVATFYTQFQLKPVGTRAHVQVCGTTPCMLRGSDALKAVCRKHIHEEQFHLNASGTLSWEEVECLGACVNAPMVAIFQDTYEDLTAERLEEIITLFDAGKADEVTPGPQNGRHLSAPLGGLTSLTGDYDDLTSKSSAGPAQGASAGAGGAASTPPSQAGRPDTHAPETDPTIDAPGKARNGNVAQPAERETSDELTEAGSRPGSGQTGGTYQGPTGAADKEEASSGGGSHTGADAVPGGQARPTLVEGLRTDTSDVTAGPVATDGPSQMAAERPEGLLDAPDGPADDLKQIAGIGPVIEAKLNELGVYHLRQIAAWREAELLWIDNHLNFRGRALREKWIDQAKTLSAGTSRPADA
ncbi:NADH-quinone oxidoreductase subunit NuoE [Aurantimonas sp. Leaf443]|uniref:NADH-quinone oxidoreductase subunit NuoE n=1 Tax=Aurantimonas sp. Leaf443 TaxID=1736378 RepID=UPI0006F59D9A|nr:NADH-quinone oxidoreductase subunit NuoE [Aurantimonas sp. Leaf443]KQT82752.1 NADH dehydrogenase [Aurantimonas sp. Leaf443]